MMKNVFSTITNACFAGLANSHPANIHKKIHENYYGYKKSRNGKYCQHALNPFSGHAVKYTNYNRISEDNLYVKDICKYADRLGIYIRVDLTQIPNCPVQNTSTDRKNLEIFIKWIEDCILNKKKITSPKFDESGLNYNCKAKCEDEDEGEDEETESKSEIDSEMDDFIVNDDDEEEQEEQEDDREKEQSHKNKRHIY